MCLSLQSLWLRRDLHEKTKTCFRGVSSPFPRAFAAPVAFSPSALVQPRGAVPCSTQNCGTVQCANAARGKAGSAGLPRAGALHFTIAKILCKASVHAQARSRTRHPTARRTRTYTERGPGAGVRVHLAHSEYRIA